MKKRHILYCLGITLVVLGCNSPKNDNPETSFSTDDEIVAENTEYKVFLHDEAIFDSIEGLPSVKQVSLWVYNKQKKQAEKMLLSHPEADCSWFSMEHAVNVSLDSIPTISKATILSWEDESLKLLVEGCPDYRNVQSFIVEADKDSAICLPTNRGLIGISEEDGLLIMQSYAYYEEERGRYNYIEAFDVKNGNRICRMEARTQN